MQNIVNPIFTIREDGTMVIGRVNGPSAGSSWYYSSVQDELLYKDVTSVASFTTALKEAAGLTQLGSATSRTVMSMTKASISARIDHV